mgnify:FL=1
MVVERTGADGKAGGTTADGTAPPESRAQKAVMQPYFETSELRLVATPRMLYTTYCMAGALNRFGDP